MYHSPYPNVPPCRVCNTNPCCCPRKQDCVDACAPPGAFSDFSSNGCREVCNDTVPPMVALPHLFCNMCRSKPCCCPPPPPQPCAPACGPREIQQPPEIRNPIGRMMADGGDVPEGDYTAQAKQLRLDATDPDQRIVRQVLITKTFSLLEAQADPRTAEWKLKSNHVFSKRNIHGHDSAPRTGRLDSCVIAHAAVISTQKEHKPAMGVKISGMSGNTYTACGDRYTHIINLREATYGRKGRTVFVPQKLIGSAFFSMYAGLTEDALDEGVNDATNEKNVAYNRVPINHITIHILRMNQRKLGFDVDSMPIINGKYEVESNLFACLRQVAIDKILKKLPYANLSAGEFRASFFRADMDTRSESHYTALEEELAAAARNPQLAESWIKTPRTISIVLELHFMIANPSYSSSNCD